MIQTIKPDDRGRVSLRQFLTLLDWKPGQAVKVDFIETVDLVNTDEDSREPNPD
jgi:hypothetical protein